MNYSILNQKQTAIVVFAYFGGVNTIRTKTHRSIFHKDGYVELYDHSKPEGETVNVADQNPELVEELTRAIMARKE